MNLFTKQKQTHRHRKKLMVTKGERRGGRDTDRGCAEAGTRPETEPGSYRYRAVQARGFVLGWVVFGFVILGPHPWHMEVPRLGV